ncbi:MAG: AzlD domain-containing protein [Formosimonas sp.]|jgi:branched-subunit amino acid transport protein
MSWENHLWLWIAILGLSVVTVVTRSFFLLTPASFEFSPLVQRALRFAPAAAIAAVIAPDILMHQEVIDVTWHNRALIASVIAGGAFVWRQSLVLTIVVGMLVFTALRLLEIGG